MNEQAAIPTPAVPRELTPLARRRAWLDPKVRFWWLAGSALTAAAIFLFVTRYINWRRDVRLIAEGTLVQATVLQADESVARGKTEEYDKPVRLSYEFQGRKYEVSSPMLQGRRRDQYIVVGSTLPIRVDPRNPELWTPRERPADFSRELTGASLTLAAGVIALLISLGLRWRVIRTWRAGSELNALILGARHTAMAPRAWSVRCTPPEDDDPRVFQVFAPPGIDASEGASIRLLLPTRGGRPLAAAWFDHR